MPAARRPASRSRYVALLRGVNVGGKSTVSMAALAETFRGLGLDDVRTYINSGNVIFSTATTPEARLTARIERAIAKDTGLPVSVLVLEHAALRSIVAAIPAAWVTDAGSEPTCCFSGLTWMSPICSSASHATLTSTRCGTHQAR